MIRQLQTSIDSNLDVFGVTTARGALQNVLLSYFANRLKPFWYELFLVYFMALVPLGLTSKQNLKHNLMEG
jgi:hypothetical protein